jgi:CRISPR-associated protein Csm4
LKFYEITICPLSGFGTTLKGDTLWGHFCWQVAYDPSLVDGSLEYVLSVYDESPFAVFSSVFPKLEKESTYYALKRPDIPLSWLFPSDKSNEEEYYKNIKENKKQKWMLLGENLGINLSDACFLNDEKLLNEVTAITAEKTRKIMEAAEYENFISHFSQPHNTINRLTQTTGADNFAPYVKENIYYYQGTKLALFVLLDENMTDIDQIKKGLENIGRFGFGRDASIGLGRFEICESNEINVAVPQNANACYLLAPCVPEKNRFKRMYFTPFIRFGKHGDRLANVGNPFKNPVVMADEGAVFIPNDKGVFDKPYIGRAVTGVSKAKPSSVVQGYAPYLPVKLEH